MRVTVLAVGRMKAGPERELAARYFDRFGKFGARQGLDFGPVVEIAESRAGNAETRMREEAEALKRHLDEDTLLLALDERGKTMDSPTFASMLAEWRDAGRRDLAMVIGGADGLHETIRGTAHTVLSLGRLTWPHQLVRVLVAEQLYRAATILAGHPYHRS